MAEERGELLAKISELESSTSAEAARAEEKFAELRAAAKKSEAELKASRAELKDTLITELQPNPFHWTEWPLSLIHI